ncbi:MAG: hypothetical protein USCAAHI_01747 [Beijerinckiaceae bacterium]|nr:MAG: hypothetical protein USCAAHI_01747 [Beijerinckiaceae bacterium]
MRHFGRNRTHENSVGRKIDADNESRLIAAAIDNSDIGTLGLLLLDKGPIDAENRERRRKRARETGARAPAIA